MLYSTGDCCHEHKLLTDVFSTLRDEKVPIGLEKNVPPFTLTQHAEYLWTEGAPAPLANECGRLHRYRTREAIEEALIPVALPTQLDCLTQAASDPPRRVEYKVGGEHLEPELSSEPEKAHHRQAMTQSEEIASKDHPHI